MSEQPNLSGQFKAWLREGANDFHNAVIPAFPDSVRGQNQPGLPLSPTSQVVTEELHGKSFDEEVRDAAARNIAVRDAEMELRGSGMER